MLEPAGFPPVAVLLVGAVASLGAPSLAAAARHLPVLLYLTTFLELIHLHLLWLGAHYLGMPEPACIPRHAAAAGAPFTLGGVPVHPPPLELHALVWVLKAHVLVSSFNSPELQFTEVADPL